MLHAMCEYGSDAQYTDCYKSLFEELHAAHCSMEGKEMQCCVVGWPLLRAVGLDTDTLLEA